MSSYPSPIPGISRHPFTGFDVSYALLSVLLVALALTSPCTPGWKLVRAGLVAPVAASGFLIFAYTTICKDEADTWGSTGFITFFGIRTFELLIFFPAEENAYRMIPKGNTARRREKEKEGPNPNGHTHLNIPLPPSLLAEPIPAPFTLEKFYWSLSLFLSFRGIGWNYCPVLPTASLDDPFSRTSSRWSFVLDRTGHYLLGWLMHDLTRSYMNLSAASVFFEGTALAPRYDTLTLTQKAIYSMCVCTRVWFSLQITFVAAGIICVIMGGAFGWETEFWTPWGWPPLFGGLGDIWRHPGLSTMWSRTWQQYYRRWLYVFGWIGLGENILRLPRSGPASRPTPSPTPLSLAPTPLASGQTSPSHPLPTLPVQRVKTSSAIKLSNFVKSLLVFFLSGLLHDLGSLMLLYDDSAPHPKLQFSEMFLVTPFFLAQPFGLTAEAFIKTRWRGYKRNRRAPEPNWMVTLERVVGFAWTWWFLGWTAGWYLSGVSRVGLYRRKDRDTYPSLIGGLVFGQWSH
ncbi:hypothetical protein P7C73_g2972, partial [Tremellales sp. Uapishka_1]